MHEIVKEILENQNYSKNDRLALLNGLAKDIEFAKDVERGIYKYCPVCDDYYLTKSFFETIDNVPTKKVMLPSAGAAYLRGDIQEAKTGYFNRMSANNYFDTVVTNRNSDVSIGLVGRYGMSYDSFDYDPEYNDNDVLIFH